MPGCATAWPPYLPLESCTAAIKPENVLLDTANGHVIPRVGDFGREDHFRRRCHAALLDDGGDSHCRGPEIADGAEPTDKADVYAVGIVLYELLSAVPPFASTSTWRTIRDHAQSQPGRPDGIPDPLWHLIDWMLSKSPMSPGQVPRGSVTSCGAQAHVLAGLPAAPAAEAPPPGGELTNRPTMQVPRLPSTPPAPVTPPPSVPEAPPTASRGRAAKGRHGGRASAAPGSPRRWVVGDAAGQRRQQHHRCHRSVDPL